MSDMRIAVALVRNDQGEVLLVRKRGTAAFMQPGGKIEGGEDPRSALVRELAEELSCTVAGDAMQFLGNAKAPAANEPGVMLDASVFSVALDGDFTIGAEITESIWLSPDRPCPVPLAPLTRDHVLPLARSMS